MPGCVVPVRHRSMEASAGVVMGRPPRQRVPLEGGVPMPPLGGLTERLAAGFKSWCPVSRNMPLRVASGSKVPT